MPNVLFYILFFLNCTQSDKSQDSDIKSDVDFTVEKIGDLPDEIDESSGIVVYDNLIWTFNDSGGENLIYGLSKKDGSIQKKITLKNTTNTDWEDIAQNDKYIFVGDIGNNDGSRKDLKIYLLDKHTLMILQFRKLKLK
ncbi:MAG: hypothetical protein HC906_08800 [Bacteroidales bacterium]|nr:hypothetical protein [Bacteroidales bacterium]